MSVAALALVAVYTGGLKLSAKSEKLMQATQISQTTLETIRDLGYEKIPSSLTTFDGRRGVPVNSEGFPPTPYPNQDDFQVLVRAHEKEPNLKSVTVTVFYDGESSVTLQTYFTPFE